MVRWKARLNLMTNDKLLEILNKPKLAEGLKTYQYLMSALPSTDVSRDKEYQKAFRSFYQMRKFYSDDFAQSYFRLLEKMKDYGTDMSFKIAFERVKHIQGSYEMSFSSKLAHTINPLLPIWDSVVTTGHFGIRPPYTGHKDRENACCDKYAIFEDVFYDYMASDDGIEIIHAFDQVFPDNGISDVKKIDFVLWQDPNNRKKK